MRVQPRLATPITHATHHANRVNWNVPQILQKPAAARPRRKGLAAAAQNGDWKTQNRDWKAQHGDWKDRGTPLAT